MDKQKLKSRAREIAFKNKWNIWKPYLYILVVVVLFGFLMSIFGIDTENGIGGLLSAILDLAIIPATIGYYSYLIHLVNGKQMDVKEALLSKYGSWKIIILTSILVGFYTLGWALLLIIPGIIYIFKVAMVNFLLAENEDKNISAKEIINTSKEMMNGYKMDYFKYMFKFYVWDFIYSMFILLVILSAVFTLLPAMQMYAGGCLIVGTLGVIAMTISAIWILPYMNISQVVYYQELKQLKNIK